VWVCACCAGLWAQALAPLARQYRESPTAARREALVKFAAAHPQDKDGALALLCLGVTAQERGDHPAALGHLKSAAARLPEIADYVSYFAGLASAGLKDFVGAAAWLDKVGKGSPLAGRAALAAARAWSEAGDYPKAIAAVRGPAAGIPQPEGDLLLATALEQTGAAAEAAYHAQRVYYGYPASKEAAEAGRMLERLRERLGAGYPPPLPEAMLARAARWLAAGNHARARREYEDLATPLGGAERDLARVRAGAARSEGGAAEAALRYLEELRVEAPEADAERLYYLVQCARRLERPEAMRAYLDELRVKHAA
jgi:soluble lytic murein transglycosylase